jgi:uncharacterized membrane protein YadS
MVIDSFRYPFQARIFPLFSGGLTLALLLVAFVIDLRQKKGEGKEAQNLRRELDVIGWFIIFFIGVYLIGYHVGIPLMVLLFLKLHARYTWRSALMYALLAFVMVLIFSNAYPLYKGLLWPF